MKRLVAALIAVCVVGSVMAQGSFTIVRPADGSKVREKIKVMIPKNSIEPGSYLGVFLNGKFVEATVPPVVGNYRVYTLDTKMPRPQFPEWKAGIPDGEMKLELVKYQGGDAPKVVDRSSVTITVGNHMNIDMPASGIKLRYAFRAGQQMVYHVYTQETLSTMSGLGNENGGHPASYPTRQFDYRLMYVIDNTYGSGEALLRMQLLPNRGKDYAMHTFAGDPNPQQVFDYQMQPVYMRVSSTGRPSFGAIPEYFGFSEGTTPGAQVNVYGTEPLPVLPSKAVKPGDSWQASYQLPVELSPDTASLTDRVTVPFPARGEFIDVEWEMGHPCAKIRNSIAEGTSSEVGKELQKQGRAFADDKASLDETIFFSLDTHKILKIIRSATIDRKVQVEGTSGGGGTPGGKGGPGMPGGKNLPQLGRGGAGGSEVSGPIGNFQKGGKNLPSLGAPGVGQGAPGLGAPGQMQPGSNRGGGGGAAPKTAYIRIQRETTRVLEQ